MFFVSTVCAPWSPVTSIRPPPNSRAVPLMTSTLFLRIKNSIPFECLATILFFFSTNAGVIQALNIFAFDALRLRIQEILPNISRMKLAALGGNTAGLRGRCRRVVPDAQ